MCYPLEKSSGFEGRVNEVGDGLVAKLCSRSKVIARNGAVAMDELSAQSFAALITSEKSTAQQNRHCHKIIMSPMTLLSHAQYEYSSSSVPVGFLC